MLWLLNSLFVWLGIAKAQTVLPKPNLKNGFQVNGVDYTADELNAALGGGDIVVTDITAGTTQTQAGATALTGSYNNVTTVGTAGDGVKLPTAAAGLVVQVRNGGAATKVLKIYPATGDAIDNQSANAGILLTPGAVADFRAIDSTNWKSNIDISNTTTLIAGQSGGAGGIIIYPSTALKGYVYQTAANNTGDTVTADTWAAQAAARTYTRPDAGGDANYAFDKAFACLTAAGAALLPAASAEAIITGGTKNIAAGALTAGNVIRFRAAVKVNAINATDTLTVRARIGAVTASLTGTVCASHISGATTAANDIVILDGYIDMQSFSTPNMTMVATGVGHGLLAGVSGVSTATLAPAFTLNTVNAVDLSITIQFSTNSGTNSATLHSFTHEIKAS